MTAEPRSLIACLPKVWFGPLKTGYGPHPYTKKGKR